METRINLIGASGHCKVIIDILLSSSIQIGTIFDDDQDKIEILGFPINHSSQLILDSNKNLILSIGNNQVRKLLSLKFNVNFATAIHSNAIISKFSKIDEGTVVMAGVIVNSDAKIGKHCILNTGSIIEHDCILENFVHISPNASLAGGVTVGEGTQVGIGATVIQGVKIGKWVVIGAGTVVINDVPDFATVVGNPARIIKYNTIHNE